MKHKSRTFALAVLFESGLGFIGLSITAFTGISIVDRLQISQAGVARGLIATLPMLAMLVVLLRTSWAPLVEVRRQVELLVDELFAQSSWLELALISVAAGVGEELLFRGALQPWIASWTHPLIALSVVSLLFGLAHAMSTSYFVLAALIGGYLGWLALEYDDLITPIVAHGVYDFVALLYVQRRVRHP
jgi:membrane protease YdiL (CAAX protease family)